jgi:spoIIIJ-associated protein
VSEQTDEMHEVDTLREVDEAQEVDQPQVDDARMDEVAADEVAADEVPADEVPADEVASASHDEEPDDSSELAAGTSDAPTSRVDQLEAEGDIAADYLEELLDIADLDGDLDMDVDGDRAAVSIVGAELSQLVGSDGEVLEALQELTRLAVYRETGERSRLMLDISGFRADKRTRLEQLAGEMVAQVKESGEPVSLDPMTPFERKVVHDAVAAAGLTSESEGVEPRRFVVVLPA